MPADITTDSKKLAALASLALLKEDMDRGTRDYTDYLRAFIEHAIAKHKVDPINSETVARALTEEFGLNLPDKVIQLVLQRMARDGALGKQGGLFSITPGKLPNHLDFDQRRRSLNSKVESLLSEFEAYIKPLGHTLSREDGLNAILGFLSQFAISYLRAYLLKSALPDFKLVSDKNHILLAEFIKRAQETGSNVFENIITLVKGQMYANALLCPDLEGVKKDFKSTNFFLDTPLVLNLLGYHGAQYKRSANELISLLKSLNGKVGVFSHTLQETTQVIRNAADWVDRADGRGNVIRNARIEGLGRTDLLVQADRVEFDLNSLGVAISNNPSYAEDFQINELDFQDTLEEKIEYYNDMAMRLDVESVRAIYCLRGKTVPMRLEDTLAVFVTTNSAFARAAYAFGKNHNSSREVSPVITDFSLANIAWLKRPMQWKDLAEVETLAACYAALEPNSSDWRRYLEKIDELADQGTLNPDEHALLRISPISRRDIINLTGDVDDLALVGGSVREILERIKSDILAPTRNELRSTREKLLEADRSASVGQSVLKQEQIALDRITSWIASLLINLIITMPLIIIIGTGLGAGAGLFSVLGFNIDNTNVLYWIVVIVTAIATFTTIFGISFNNLIKDMKHRLASKLKSLARGSTK